MYFRTTTTGENMKNTFQIIPEETRENDKQFMQKNKQNIYQSTNKYNWDTKKRLMKLSANSLEKRFKIYKLLVPCQAGKDK